MPKNKTHSGTKRRFRLTGSGKVMRERANNAHYSEHKPRRVKRRLTPDVVVSKKDTTRVKRLLGK